MATENRIEPLLRRMREMQAISEQGTEAVGMEAFEAAEEEVDRAFETACAMRPQSTDEARALLEVLLTWWGDWGGLPCTRGYDLAALRNVHACLASGMVTP